MWDITIRFSTPEAWVIPLHYHYPYATYHHVSSIHTPSLIHSILSTTISLIQITFIFCELCFLSSLCRHATLLSLIHSHPLQLSFWNTKLSCLITCLNHCPAWKVSITFCCSYDKINRESSQVRPLCTSPFICYTLVFSALVTFTFSNVTLKPAKLCSCGFFWHQNKQTQKSKSNLRKKPAKAMLRNTLPH